MTTITQPGAILQCPYHNDTTPSSALVSANDTAPKSIAHGCSGNGDHGMTRYKHEARLDFYSIKLLWDAHTQFRG